MFTSRREFLKAGCRRRARPPQGSRISPRHSRKRPRARRDPRDGSVPPARRPHDHFDLAVYALAAAARVRPARVVIRRHPPDFRAGDPAAVALCKQPIAWPALAPVSIRERCRRLQHRRDALPAVLAQDTVAVRFILEQLCASARPVSLVACKCGRHRSW